MSGEVVVEGKFSILGEVRQRRQGLLLGNVKKDTSSFSFLFFSPSDEGRGSEQFAGNEFSGEAVCGKSLGDYL